MIDRNNLNSGRHDARLLRFRDKLDQTRVLNPNELLLADPHAQHCSDCAVFLWLGCSAHGYSSDDNIGIKFQRFWFLEWAVQCIGEESTFLAVRTLTESEELHVGLHFFLLAPSFDAAVMKDFFITPWKMT